VGIGVGVGVGVGVGFGLGATRLNEGEGAATTATVKQTTIARPSMRPKPVPSARESRNGAPINAIPEKTPTLKNRTFAGIIGDPERLIAARKSFGARLPGIVVRLPQREFPLFNDLWPVIHAAVETC
jgi:hypothetical protein